MEQEKIFNLQITVQKLEEELSLYRNGTTHEQIFDLIQEKDDDIDNLRAELEQKDATLRKIAKSSADVLQRCDVLQDKVSELENEKKLLSDQVEEKETARTLLEQKCSEQSKTLSELTENLRIKDCEGEAAARLLAESKTTSSNLLLKLDQATQRAEDLEARLNEKETSVSKLRDQLTDSDKAVEKLQKRCAELVAEKAEKLKQLDAERKDMLHHVQKFRESMNTNLAQRDEALRRKEERIKELTVQLSIAHEETKVVKLSIRNNSNNSSSSRPSMNENVNTSNTVSTTQNDAALLQKKMEVNALQSKVREQERRIAQLDAQRTHWSKDKSELEVLKQRMAHIENRNKIGLERATPHDVVFDDSKNLDNKRDTSSAVVSAKNHTTEEDKTMKPRRQLTDRTNDVAVDSVSDRSSGSSNSSGSSYSSGSSGYSGGTIPTKPITAARFGSGAFATVSTRPTATTAAMNEPAAHGKSTVSSAAAAALHFDASDFLRPTASSLHQQHQLGGPNSLLASKPLLRPSAQHAAPMSFDAI